jgi:hypothetical protein
MFLKELIEALKDADGDLDLRVFSENSEAGGQPVNFVHKLHDDIFNEDFIFLSAYQDPLEMEKRNAAKG